MNRREALAALVALPEVTRISVARMGPADVIVVEAPMRLSAAQVEAMTERLTKVWPDRRIVILGQGMTLKVVKSDA